MTVEESLATFAPVLARARDLGWWTRGYVSTAFGCPYTGRVEPSRAVEVAARLVELGVDESASATRSGSACPAGRELTGLTAGAGPLERVAYHFHDTRGTALANVAAGLRSGIRCFDSAAGGTGGCPYAPGAAGNLATEDLAYLLDAEGWETGCRLLASWRRLGSSPARSAGRSPPRSARPVDGTRRRERPSLAVDPAARA